MEKFNKDNQMPESENNKQDCGCEDGCCQPKKKNNFSKVIFAVILLTALAIIGVKLVGRSGNDPVKQMVSSPGCDTAKTCDTTKGSSCCPKK